MMNHLLKLVMLMLVATLMVVGCSKPSVPEPPLTTMKLHELYPGDMKNVDYIEIRSGSTGKLKSYTDKKQVQTWINEVVFEARVSKRSKQA